MSQKLLSYAITVCNEEAEFPALINQLCKHINSREEIVILFDRKNGTDVVRAFLGQIRTFYAGVDIAIHEADFTGDFAQWKNLLNSYCQGEYIFNIDADEQPSEELLQLISTYLSLPAETHEKADLWLIPRINIVEGITQAHINRWNWSVNAEGWINWPDYQARVYKNSESIKWQGKVHESVVGWNSIINELDYPYTLSHIKSIEKQEKQNSLYDSLIA